MKKSVVIYGFGRMGLTHYAILNQLIKDINFTFVEVDKRLNYFARKNVKAKIVRNDKHLEVGFDYALICTPPVFHVPIMENCLKRGDNHIFVEKPFGGIRDDYSIIKAEKDIIRVGYVMRFNPIFQWVKENISIENIMKVKGSYLSNTIEKKPKGWRNRSYSGVLNEMGSHIIDLSVYLFNLKNPDIIEKNKKSVITDVDDIVIAEVTENDIEYNFHFDWVNKDYRKPVLNLNVTMNNGIVYNIDQQKVEVFKDNHLERSISTVDLINNVPFYLRGVDFTRQMEDLIGDQRTLATVDEALITRDFIKNILEL